MPIDPSNLRIQHYPAEVLRKRAKSVDPADPDVRKVAERMVELMYEAEGIGLAAPQVGLPWRVFVVDIPEEDGGPPEAGAGSLPVTADSPPTATSGPVVYINPVLSRASGELVSSEEGCLSLPDIRGQVLRAPVITITAMDVDGKEFTQTGAGLLARCWQHEFDHLEGVLIIDRFTQLSRLKNRSAVRDLERSAAK
jgi:peptide deformylase